MACQNTLKLIPVTLEIGEKQEKIFNDGFDLTFFKVIAADKHGAKVKIILGILGKQFT